MADIGQRADLTVLTKSPHGLFLDAGGDLGEVLDALIAEDQAAKLAALGE